MATTERISVILQAVDNASPPLQKFNTTLGQTKVQAGAAEKSNSTLGASFNKLGDELRTAAFGFGALKVLNVIGDLNKLGVEAQGTTAIFNKMAGGIGKANDLLDKLRSATGNVVTDMDLMGGANQLMRMGIAENAEEVQKLIDMAMALKKPAATAADAMDNFALMLANKSTLRLDSFGISAAAVRLRIDELLASGQALNGDEAFKMAVMEQGAVAMDRLGDAANISETSFNRLQTRFENFKVVLGGVVADAVEAGSQILELASLIDEAFRKGEGGDTLGVVKDVIDEELGQGATLNMLGSAIPGLATTTGALNALDVATSNREPPVTGLPAGTGGRITESDLYNTGTMDFSVGPIFKPQEVMNQWQNTLANMTALPFGHIQKGLDKAIADIKDKERQMYQYATRFSEGQSVVNSGRGNLGLMSPGAIATAKSMAEDLEIMFQNMSDNELVSDHELSVMEGMRDTAKDLATEAEKAQQAFESMSLAQMMGQTSGGRLGELSDLVTQNIGDEDLKKQAQQGFDVASGRETDLSLAMKDVFAPTMARITEQQGVDAATAAMEEVLKIIEQGQVGGVDPTIIRGQAAFGLMDSQYGISDTVSNVAGSAWNNFMTGFGGGDTSTPIPPLPFGMGAIGESPGREAGFSGMATDATSAIEPLTQVDALTRSISDSANNTKFDGMNESLGSAQGIISESMAMVDDWVAKANEVTINIKMKVSVESDNPDGTKLLSQAMSKVQADNGGTIPEF